MVKTIGTITRKTDEFVRVKHRGQIYTPDYLVEIILDFGHYIGGNINKKHIIDNSCGDGQFLIHIVDRYCKDYLSLNGSNVGLKDELETYIHAIEIDYWELLTCSQRCNEVARIYGVENVSWDFLNCDALTESKYNGSMDFVIGNPPYVRIHNLNTEYENVKNHLFCSSGMTDLYISFYEIGLQMLNDNGILTYITPSSFFTSLAGENMRKYFTRSQILETICDLKHFQPFDANTYTTIVCLNKGHNSQMVDYYEFNQSHLKPYYVDTLHPSNFYINNFFYFSTKTNLKILSEILNNYKFSDVSIKNGYATLADKIFIGNFDFDSKYVIPIIKASKGQLSNVIYPYDASGNLISEEELKTDTNLFNYLFSNIDSLRLRSMDNTATNCWYAFGRSQGIGDTYKNKLAINNLIRTETDLKIVEAPAGCGVYSGLYIISNSIPFEKIKQALNDEEFGKYISMLGKYKSGGYYTFSSKDVKFYLDYKLGNGGIFDYVNK